jgi:hypothetical protein
MRSESPELFEKSKSSRIIFKILSLQKLSKFVDCLLIKILQLFDSFKVNLEMFFSDTIQILRIVNAACYHDLSLFIDGLLNDLELFCMIFELFNVG